MPTEVSNFVLGSVATEEATVKWSSAPGDLDDYDLFLTPNEGVTGEPCPRGVQGNTYTFKGKRYLFN